MQQKDIEKLEQAICDKGVIHVLKAGKVFTLYMTGKGLSSAHVLGHINLEVLANAAPYYPNVEVMKNEDNYILMVLTK